MEYRYVLFFVVLVVLGVALFAFCKNYSVYFLWNTGHIVTWNEEKCCLIDCPMCKLEGLSNKLDNCIKRLEKSLLDDETEENLSK